MPKRNLTTANKGGFNQQKSKEIVAQARENPERDIWGQPTEDDTIMRMVGGRELKVKPPTQQQVERLSDIQLALIQEIYVDLPVPWHKMNATQRSTLIVDLYHFIEETFSMPTPDLEE